MSEPEFNPTPWQEADDLRAARLNDLREARGVIRDIERRFQALKDVNHQILKDGTLDGTIPARPHLLALKQESTELALALQPIAAALQTDIDTIDQLLDIIPEPDEPTP